MTIGNSRTEAYASATGSKIPFNALKNRRLRENASERMDLVGALSKRGANSRNIGRNDPQHQRQHYERASSASSHPLPIHLGGRNTRQPALALNPFTRRHSKCLVNDGSGLSGASGSQGVEAERRNFALCQPLVGELSCTSKNVRSSSSG